MSNIVEIKDKLLTIESAQTLHDYAENTYAKHTYVDEQIQSVSAQGIPKLVTYPLPLLEAKIEGQTEFTIYLDTFDDATDTVLVWSGRTYLHQNADYIVSSNKIILTEGVPLGRTIAIVVLKNVPMGDDGSINGSVFSIGSIPIDRLAKDVVLTDGSIPMTGSLQLHDGHAIAGASSTRAVLNSYPDNTDQSKYRGFAVLNHTDEDDKSNAFVVAENNGSGERIYKLYGEHNNDFNNTIWTGNGTDNGYGFISSNKSLTQLGITNAKKDVTKNRNLEISNSNYKPNLKNALMLSDSDGTTTIAYSIYGEHNKPTAEDVDAIPETDRELLVKSIGSNKDFTEIRNNGSFIQRIIGGASEEVSSKYPELYGTHAGFRSYKNGCYWMHFYMTYNNFYIQHTSDANDITLEGWRKIDSGNCLPLDGGTPMTGNYIMMNNGWGLFESNNHGSSVFANNTQTTANFANARGISIMNSSTNIKNAFQIRDKVNEVTTVYNVFGEHNVTCGTTDIEAGSALTGIYEVYQ